MALLLWGCHDNTHHLKKFRIKSLDHGIVEVVYLDSLHKVGDTIDPFVRNSNRYVIIEKSN